MAALVAVTVFAVGGVIAVPAAVSSPDYPVGQANQPHQYLDVELLALPAASDTAASDTAASTAPSSTTTVTAPAPTPAVLASTPVVSTAPTPTPTPTPAPAPAAPPAPAVPAVPAVGQATAWGCSAALAYLQAYAAPGFALDCPGYAEGHEAMTCLYGHARVPGCLPERPDDRDRRSVPAGLHERERQLLDR